jgi:hypothetical protein
VLGTEPPSEDVLRTECHAILSIAAAEELELPLGEEASGASGNVRNLEDELVRLWQKTTPQQEDDEDYDFDFVNNHRVVEDSDSGDEGDDPCPARVVDPDWGREDDLWRFPERVRAPDAAHRKGEAKQPATKPARAQEATQRESGHVVSRPKQKTAAAAGSAPTGAAAVAAAQRPPWKSEAAQSRSAAEIVEAVLEQGAQLPPADHKLTAGIKKELLHAGSAGNGHGDFVCDCPLARARCQRSCLKQFTGEQLATFHTETFGVYVSKEKTSADVGPRAIGARIHRLMWPLREDINADGSPDEQGRYFRIRKWKLGTKEVCRKAWERAYGARGSRYRAIYSIVQRGHGPEHEESAGQVGQVTAL